MFIIFLSFILVFITFNNVMHVGIHVGHAHEDYVGDSIVEYEEDHDDGEVADFEIYPGDVVKKIQNNEDVILLDVRTLEEYQETHLENSLLLPVQELSQQALNKIGLGEDMKDKEIIIYCRSGNRSKTAYDIMDSLGYTNIKSVSGGMVHWEEDNYPFTESGEYKGVLSNTEMSEEVDSGPRIFFDRILYDFGDVPQSAGVISTTFEIMNIGNEKLEIGALSTSCGCTTAEISGKSIDPGNSATLTVSFDPDFHSEPSDKLTRTVFIPTNDINQPEAEVKITVDILEGE
ncbi:MAG: DUF1573 domain-containing protein [Lewinellaceae bacterium]|nr:DUF1573 domain-containing protein [Lewinellaceae bacterium]